MEMMEMEMEMEMQLEMRDEVCKREMEAIETSAATREAPLPECLSDTQAAVRRTAIQYHHAGSGSP